MAHDNDLDTLRRELAAVQAALADVRRTVDAQLTHTRFAGRFCARLARLLRPDAMVLVAAKGDDGLLALGPAHAAHFPQALDGQFAGAYPADDAAAIAHLEALRREGYDTLVFPAYSSWWLEHYTGLRTHLETRCTPVAADDLCAVFDLSMNATSRGTPSALQLLDALRLIERQIGRRPTLLDWRSGPTLQAACTDYAMAASDETATLPHFDRSVDVVAIPAGDTSVVAEARRVAAAALIRIDEQRAVRLEWVTPARPLEAAAAGGDEMLVWIADGIAPLPGWRDAVMSVFERDPSAGAVGGRVLDFTGRLHHAGGLVLADGSVANIGEADLHPDDPRYLFVREVDFCSSSFMVTTRRAFEEAGGFDESLPDGPYRDADFGLRLRERGYSVYVQPEALAVCNRTITSLLRSSVPAGDERAQRRRFAERWQAALRTRPAAFDPWGASAASRLPLTGPGEEAGR